MYLPRGLPISIQRAARCCHKLESRVTRGELVYGAQIFTSIYKLRYLPTLLSTGARPTDDNLIFPESIRAAIYFTMARERLYRGAVQRAFPFERKGQRSNVLVPRSPFRPY